MIDKNRFLESLMECKNIGRKSLEIVLEVLIAQPEIDDWILCRERLPEEEQKVIISTKTDVITTGIYTKRYGFGMREGFICDDGFMWLNTAVAWRPFPEAYKAGD